MSFPAVHESVVVLVFGRRRLERLRKLNWRAMSLVDQLRHKGSLSPGRFVRFNACGAGYRPNAASALLAIADRCSNEATGVHHAARRRRWIAARCARAASSDAVDGVSDFNALHSGKHNEEVQLCAFDVLAMDGDDLRHLPLSMRKANLVRLLARRPDGIFIATSNRASGPVKNRKSGLHASIATYAFSRSPRRPAFALRSAPQCRASWRSSC